GKPATETGFGELPDPGEVPGRGELPGLDDGGRPGPGFGVPAPTMGLPMRIGQLLPAALLAALVVSQTVVAGTSLVVDARLAGVIAGAIAVWRGAPFWLVLIVAAGVTALIRLAAG
ncbi:MAG: AzlD domain-containing protein, partial [Acidimicrobiales bacterium]